MSEPNKRDLRETLQKSLDQAEWTWLIPHMEREALVIVSQDLDIVDVGMQIVQDNSPTVQEWIRTQKIDKPTPAQIRIWENSPSKRFRTLIVQPYVLAQECPH